MHRESAIAIAVVLCTSFAAAQQAASPAPPAEPQAASTPHAAPTVYYAGPGVTAPELRSSIGSLGPPHRCEELNGMVVLSAIVDTYGLPHSVKIIKSDSTDLGNFAVGLIATERFKPGTYNGAPATVATKATVGLQTCIQTEKKAKAGTSKDLVLRSHPEIAIDALAQAESATESDADSTAERPSVSSALLEPDAQPPSANVYVVGRDVTAPELLPREFSCPPVRHCKKLDGTVLVSVTIDELGLPRNVDLIRPTATGLDNAAMSTVSEDRFKPGVRNGVPVAVAMSVEIGL